MHPNLTPDSKAEYLSCSWQCDLAWNHWGWKRSVRSLSPSFNAALPSPPLNYSPRWNQTEISSLRVWRRGRTEHLPWNHCSSGAESPQCLHEAPSTESLAVRWLSIPLQVIVSVQHFYTHLWLVQLGKMTSLTSRKALCKDFFKLLRKWEEDLKIFTFFLSVIP